MKHGQRLKLDAEGDKEARSVGGYRGRGEMPSRSLAEIASSVLRWTDLNKRSIR